jgi:hypothetical protein
MKRRFTVNYSRKLIGFYIKTSVLILRLIGKCKVESDFFKSKILVNYFAQKYLPITKNLPKKETAAETTETIWQFWDNPTGKTTPEIVKASVKSVGKFKGNFEHKILDNSTVKNYTDLPSYVFDRLNKKQMTYAHFSDLLRLNLLKNHGGIWIDATAYMTDFIPQYILDEDFFVFLTGKQTHFPYAFMQNCFIRSKRGSFLCEAWYQICIEYWKNETKTLDYFQHQLMFKALVEKNLTAKDLFNKMPQKSEDETHQLVGDNLLKKFDAQEWEKMKKASFFQKTTYKVTATPVCETYFSRLCEGDL